MDHRDQLHYLDAIRTFALLTGIVFHASLSFVPVFIGWAVMDISTSNVISGFVLVSHSFRMPLFFIIAGLFSHIAITSKGKTGFIKARLFRIGIPFAVGWFILYPLISSGWIMGSQSLRGDVDIIEGLIMGFRSLLSPTMGYFVGTHLWFLYYLLMITALVVFANALISKYDKLYRHLQTFSTKVITWLCTSDLGIFPLSLLTAIGLWYMQNWGLDTPDKSLIPHLPVLLIYTGCFLIGWLINGNRNLIDALAKLSWIKVLVLAMSIVSCFILVSYQMNPNIPNYLMYRAFFCISYGMMMWSIIMITISVFRKLFRAPNKIVQYLSDTSYWIYLIHLPIVVWLQISFAEVNTHWLIKLPVICLITIGISLLIYEGFVRPTFIGKILSGKKKSRIVF